MIYRYCDEMFINLSSYMDTQLYGLHLNAQEIARSRNKFDVAIVVNYLACLIGVMNTPEHIILTTGKIIHFPMEAILILV